MCSRNEIWTQICLSGNHAYYTAFSPGKKYFFLVYSNASFLGMVCTSKYIHLCTVLVSFADVLKKNCNLFLCQPLVAICSVDKPGIFSAIARCDRTVLWWNMLLVYLKSLMNSNIEFYEVVIAQNVTAHTYMADQMCVIELMSFIYLFPCLLTCS